MKKTSGIVLLLVLAFSLVPVPAFAGKAELSLKYWHAGVSGADFRIGEVEEISLIRLTAMSLNCRHRYAYVAVRRWEELYSIRVILLSPTVSPGVSYWEVNRASQASFALIISVRSLLKKDLMNGATTY